MWHKGWREEIWRNIDQEWDVIIVGGGITGAGVLRQAVSAGLRALLIEQGDFSSGTSSRSSKLIHGGFRYLREGQIQVTRESVREREWLLKEAPNLVTKLGFLLPDYESFNVPMSQFGLGVTIYDLLAPKWEHRRMGKNRIMRDFPDLRSDGLMGGFLYHDAAMDDSRIVIRLLREAVSDGGVALSYARAESLMRRKDGSVCGVVVRDTASTRRSVEVRSRVVVNACGPFSDGLRAQVGGLARIRKLRGSHLIFSQERWPLRKAATLIHPRDHRALFVIPWEGTSMVGTTDLDHAAELETKYAEPFASQGEIEYLLEALNFLFPGLNAAQRDILSTFGGVRPTISSGDTDNPSHVSRAHALWDECGLLTITGGKYTTFRIMSRQTIAAVLKALQRDPQPHKKGVFKPLKKDFLSLGLPGELFAYLHGRHGGDIHHLLECAAPGEIERVPALNNIWAELRWAARDEGVEHLDDLLLRRVRLGMLLPDGARSLMTRIRATTQSELGWSDERWQSEESHYFATWKTYYSPYPG